MKNTKVIGYGMINTKSHGSVNYGQTVDVLESNDDTVLIKAHGSNKSINIARKDVTINWF